MVYWQDINCRKQKITIDKLNESILKLKSTYHNLSLKYKGSYKKKFYSQFNSVSDLYDFRLRIVDLQYRCNEKIRKLYNILDECNKNYTIMLNNLLYYEMLNKK